MTNKFWVGGSGNINDPTNHISTTSGGAPSAGNTLTAADNLFFDALSGTGTVTLNANFAVRSFQTVGSSIATCVHNAAITGTVGDATAGTSNKALDLSGFTTYTLGNVATSAWSFVSTSATVQTITTNGKTLGNETFNASSNGSWKYADAHVSTGTVTVTKGSWDTNNQTFQASKFDDSNANVRSVTLGSSVLTLTFSGEAWTHTTTTNLTFNAGTSTIKFTGANASMRSNSATYYNVEYNGGGNMVLNSGGNAATYNRLTVNGTAVQTDTLSLGGNNGHTINDGLYIIGNSPVNRVLVFGPTLGTQRSVVLGASATFKTTSSNFDLQDTTFSGGATNERDFSASVTVGDRGGNSGITFPASVTQTFSSGAGSWSNISKWTTRVPLPQDDVIFNASSGNCTMDVFAWGRDITFTLYTGTLTRASSNTPNVFFGSVILGTSMNMGTAPNTFYCEPRGRSTHTVTSNGQTWFNATSNNRFDVNAPGGQYSLTDNAIFRPTSDSFSTQVTVVAGTFITGPYTHYVGQLGSATTTYARTLNVDGSTFNHYTIGTQTIINLNATNLTFSNTGTTYNVTGVGLTTRTIAMGGLTFGTINHTAADSLGTLVFTGGGTINVLNVSAGRRVTFPSTVVTNVLNRNIQGTVGGWGYQVMNTLSSGIFISAPHSAALAVSSDITIKFKIQRFQAYNSGNIGAVVCKLNAGLTAGYCVRINGGIVTFFAAGSQGSANANLTTVFNSGDIAHVMIQRRQSDGRTQFFTSPDDVTYTQLGSNVTIASGVALGATTDLLYIGCRTINNDNFNEGRIYRVQIFSDITQTTSVFDANFQTKPAFANTFTESSPQAATVTIQPELAPGDGRTEVLASSAGNQASVLNTTGLVTSDGIYVKDILASPTSPWYAGANSSNGGNNTNVIFTGPPGTSNGMFAFFN